MSLLEQVTEQLKVIDIEDEDISEYITGIIEDASTEADEKCEVISEFLAEVTDKSTDGLVEKLLVEYQKLQEDESKAEEEKKEKRMNEERARENERRLKIEKEHEENIELRNAQKQTNKEKKEVDENLIREYGYIAEGDDENENKEEKDEHLSPRDRRRGKTLPQADLLLAANRNADIIKEKDKKRREEMKVAADKEKERNKLLLANQKKEKTQDKEKKKTQKGERRRM